MPLSFKVLCIQKEPVPLWAADLSCPGVTWSLDLSLALGLELPEVESGTFATADQVSRTTGKYFNEKNQEVKSSKYSRDSSNIKALMEMSMKYLS